MTDHNGRPSGFVGRFLGSWELALGELVIVFLGVLIALWADQAIQARDDPARAREETSARSGRRATTTTTTDGTDSITETPPCGAVAAVTTATPEGVAARWMSFSECSFAFCVGARRRKGV